MSKRIFKRKSNRRSTCNFESNREVESLTSYSSAENDADSSVCATTIPNRIFIGGLSTSTNEHDIHIKFSKYGHVEYVKIIRDNLGNSKGYGFVTFSTKEEAKYILEMAQVFIKGRKLNIRPAIRKKTNQIDYYLTETSSADSVSEEMIQNHSRKNTSKYMKYPSNIVSTNISYLFKTPGFLSATTFQNYPVNSNENSQMNCILPYSTLVYLSQYPCQYPVGIVYPTGANFPDLIPVIVVPAMTCCTNERP